MAEVSDTLSIFTNYADLAAENVGGSVIFATDDWFAPAENMLKLDDPEFRHGVFTECGKWMDGWETRRKRIAGHDWCIIQLGCAGVIKGVEISTRFFTGNYPPAVSIQAACLEQQLEPRTGDRMGMHSSDDECKEIEKLGSEEWEEILTQVDIQPGDEATHKNLFRINSNRRFTHIRLNLFPDGGIARLRVHGKVERNWKAVSTKELVDLAAMVNGGICVQYSDAHYGHARNVIAPDRAKKMDEGWETARRRDRPGRLTEEILPDHGGEWAVYKLGHKGEVKTVVIDTLHFKGNYPYSCTIQGCLIENNDDSSVASEKEIQAADWKPILKQTKLGPHQTHAYSNDEEMVVDCGPVNYVKLCMNPDGGISRMHLWGHISI